MKQLALAIISTALLATAGNAQAGEAGTMPAASAAALPAEAGHDATTWLLLAEVSVTDGEVTTLQSCLDQARVASMVNSFAQQLEAVAAPPEPSRPWLSCDETGCP